MLRLSRSAFIRALAGGAFLGLASLITAAEPEAPQTQTGPTPSWVEQLTWSATPGANRTGFPGEILLMDDQNKLTTESSDFYRHFVVRLLNSEGVRQNAEQTIVYDPEYEQITWHKLAITRGDEVIDRLPSAQFRRLQRERNLETQMLNGQITIATVLSDVRVGDVIEIAYTLHDTNPLFRGHVSSKNYLGSSYPIQRQRILVRTPADGPRTVAAFTVPPGTQNLPDALFRPVGLSTTLETETIGSEKIYRWERTGLPAIVFDDSIAMSAVPYYPTLQIGDINTWLDVVDWAEPIFSRDIKLPDSARALITTWKANPNAGARLAAAVHWVQDDIRYFAMEMGVQNLRPRPPTEVCSTRFGDCKDKALLLSVMLRELGFEAWPALVNTYWRDRLKEVRPSPSAFNHAIVAYRYNGRLCWIDATLKGQHGSPGEWALPPYRVALIVRPGENQLTDIVLPKDPEPDTFVTDVITLDPKTHDATLSTTLTIHGIQADFYRQRLEDESPEEISKGWFNFIGRFYRRIEEIDAPVVSDPPDGRFITVTARYRLPEFVRQEGEEMVVPSIYAYMLRALIEPPTSRRRHWPYALASDRFVRHRIEMAVPFSMTLEQQPRLIIADGVEFRAEKGVLNNRFTAVHDLRTTSEFVPAARMDGFCTAMDEIFDAMSTSLHGQVAPKTTSTAPQAPPEKK